jgi:hypothetical protein
MSWSEKGKKYPFGLWLFILHFLWLSIVGMIKELNFFDASLWLVGNVIIITVGSFLGFISFKTDIRCEYEPYREGIDDLIFNKRSWWIWLLLFQTLNLIVRHDIGKPNWFTTLMMGIFTSIVGELKNDLTIPEQISIANILLCAIYTLTAPLRRLQRIEKMLYNDGKSYEDKEE